MTQEDSLNTLANKSAQDRREFIGGSDARIIMGNDGDRLYRLWKEKRGEVKPEDLSGELIVQLGTVTEPLNRSWYEKNTGHLVQMYSGGLSIRSTSGWLRPSTERS